MLVQGQKWGQILGWPLQAEIVEVCQLIFMIFHSYFNAQAISYILLGRLARLKTLVYKINAAEYIKVYRIKHNVELKQGLYLCYAKCMG